MSGTTLGISILLSGFILFIGTESLQTTFTCSANQTNCIIVQNCTSFNVLHLKDNIKFNRSFDQLMLNHCSLTELPNALFVKYPNLSILEITDSRLKIIHDYALNGLKRLQFLNLSRNNLTEIKSWSEELMEQLLSLDLRRNLITEINQNCFSRYPNLNKLNLAVNLISRISEGTFKRMNYIKYINLGKNLLTKIESYHFKSLNKLTHLLLHHNRIVSIDPFSFVSNSHLKSLRLDGNEIKELDATQLTSLPRLNYLNLSDNALIGIADNSFEKNVELKLLDISYNNITKLEQNTFNGLQSLEVLNISNNQIEYFNSNVFQDVEELLQLDMSQNFITNFENDLFEFLTNVKLLNFSWNLIKTIESNVFTNLYQLETLDLSYNQLKSDNFLNPKQRNLKCLNLTNNIYETINLSKLQNFEKIKLCGNPWICSWLIAETMKTNRKNIKFGRNYVIESKDNVFVIPEISCIDEKNGEKRSILLLHPLDQYKIDDDDDKTEPVISSHQTHRTSSYKKLIHDEFDYKSIILWLTIAVIAVFGFVRIGKMFMQRSEKKSEELRRAQQEKVLQQFHKYFERCDEDIPSYHYTDIEETRK